MNEATARWLAGIRHAAYARLGRAVPVFSAEANAQRFAESMTAIAPGGHLERELSRALEEHGLDPTQAAASLAQLRRNVAQVTAHSIPAQELERARSLAPAEVDPRHTLILERARATLEGLAEVGHGALVARLGELRGSILLSTLPTGEINARAIRAPGKAGFVIAFEPAFFDFFYHTSNAFADSIDVGRAQAFANRQAEGETELLLADAIRWGDPAPVQAFYDTLHSFVFQGVPPVNLPAYLPESFELAEHLRDSMMLFVTAHEYAHILLGHLDVEAHATSFGTSRAQEIEADKLGWRMADTALAAKGVPAAVRPMGAALFLISAMILELARGISTAGAPQNLAELVERAADHTDSSHPPAAQRLGLLNVRLPSMYPQHAARGAEYYIALLLEVAQQFWVRIEPVLRLQLSKGLQPMTVWEGWDSFCQEMESE